MKVNIELSFISRKYYRNYVDNRFNSGGYYMIVKSDSEIGFGSAIGYLVENIEFSLNYNSARKLGIGFRYNFI